MKLLGPVNLSDAPGPREDPRVTRQLLPRGAAREELEQHSQVIESRYQTLHAEEGDVDLRQGCHQAAVAFVRDETEGAGVRDGEVRPCEANVRVEEDLAELPSRGGGKLRELG
jgi:hypothetical protein